MFRERVHRLTVYTLFEGTSEPQTYHAMDLTVEGDASAASYFSALATIHGGTVTLENLRTSTLQGDSGFLKICQELGASVTSSDKGTIITGPNRGNLLSLEGDIDMGNMPDVAPTLMAIAPLIPGVTTITGLSTLRIKESDRIAAPAKELKKLGIRVVERQDSLDIYELPTNSGEREIEIETYHDHRMAMSFAILGTKLGNLKILDPTCVEKTYPLFWEDLAKFDRLEGALECNS